MDCVKKLLIILFFFVSSIVNAEETITDQSYGLGYIKNNFLKLDQTAPQTVSNGAPNFSAGLISPTITGGTTTTSDLNLQTTSGVGAAGADMHFLVGNNGATEALTILNTGNVGIGTTAPTAVLHLKAGTATASTAPLKFTSGALLATPEAGAIEFLSDAYYATITTGAARKTFAFLESPVFTGTVTFPSPFTLGATSVTTTGTQLNYLNAATGTTGTTSTSLVFSTSPVLVTPNVGVATATSVTGPAGASNTLAIASGAVTVSAGNNITITASNGVNASVAANGGNVTITSGSGNNYQGTGGSGASIDMSGATGASTGSSTGASITLTPGRGSYASGNIYLRPQVTWSSGANIHGQIICDEVNNAAEGRTLMTFSGTLGIMNNPTTFTAIDFNYTNVNHTNGYINLIRAENITGDAQCTEEVLYIGTGYDYGVYSLSTIASGNGTAIQTLSAGDDKYTSLSHDDTNAILASSSGNVTLDPNSGYAYVDGILSMNAGVASTKSDILISVRTPIVNFKTVANTNILTVPAGYYLLIDRMEIVTTICTVPDVAPTVQFGNTGDVDAYYGPTTTTSNSVYSRHIIDTPLDGIEAATTVLAGITVASTAATHSGYFRLIGSLVKSTD